MLEIAKEGSRMEEGREVKRHERTLEEIRNAKTKEDLPNSTLSKVTKYLADNVYFNDRHISSVEFKPVLQALLNYYYVFAPEVREAFMQVLMKNYPENTQDEYNSQYEKILATPNITNYIIEAGERNAKIEEFQKEENFKQYQEIIKQIRNAYEIKDLPKVGKGVLNRKIQKATQNDFTGMLPITIINEISNKMLQGVPEEETFEAIYRYCEEIANGDEEKLNLMYAQIESGLMIDETIEYTVEELQAKDERVLEIYKQDHEETMDNIKNARRISQLPPNLTISTLANYLSGNTTIYPKGEKISPKHLKDLTTMLLELKDFSSPEVEEEIRKIAQECYPEKQEEASILLKEKLSTLPRTNYFVEEIRYSLERQQEFVGRNASNVNVYFVPNNNSPIEGGRFYNCYINRVDNLNLEQILPLDLEKIVPDGMDVDSIEWYVQEHYDPTFKVAGGIILNKDETIGNVNVFKPSDGTIGITPEEHSKFEELKELGVRVKELIKAKKENAARFKEAQEAFLKYETESDKELAELEERINNMVDSRQDEPEIGD